MKSSQSTKKPILVVEDNPADVDLLRYALDEAGVDAELVMIENGEDAITFVRGDTREETEIALAILDLNLPRGNGLEILQAMRARKAFSATPVVIFTSSTSPDDANAIQREGSAKYIVKPAGLREFLQVGTVLKALLDPNRSTKDSI